MKPYKSNQTRQMPENPIGMKFIEGGTNSHSKPQRDTSQASALSENAGSN